MMSRVLHHLAPSSGGGWTAGILLSSIPKLSGFAEDNYGELYLIGYQGNIYDLPCGTLCDDHGGVSGSSSCMDQSDNIPTYEEVGCFADGSPRAMTLARAPACNTMNAEMCASFCATLEGAMYFAMEYQRECYCSAVDYEHDEYGEIDSDECNMPCSGYPEQRCGGDNTMNVYILTGEGSPRVEGAEEVGGGDDLPAPTADNYLGCFGDDKEDRALAYGSTKSADMSVEVCHAFCSKVDGATIFAVEFGHECHCGTDQSDFEYYGEVDTCDTVCEGDAGTVCGGELSMSVYHMEDILDADDIERDSIIEWHDSFYSSIGDGRAYDDDDRSDDEQEGYDGCYADKGGEMRAMQTKVAASDNMTVARCRAFCKGSDIFGLEYGEECWCGDGELDDENKVVDEECDYPCTGNPDTTCGGFWRIAAYKRS